MIMGIWAFIKTLALFLLVTEVSFIIEESINVKLALRKGFTGTKTSLFGIVTRHVITFLRIEKSFQDWASSGFRFLLYFLAAGILPIWNGQSALTTPHSLWVFLALYLVAPIFELVVQWLFHDGAGWPVLLVTAERNLGASTVLLVLATSIVALTGQDTFEGLLALQQNHAWLILDNPLSIFLAIGFAVTSLFTTFHGAFSRTGDEAPRGYSPEVILPFLRRALWSVFIADVFLGGASHPSIINDILFFVKIIVLNVAISSLSKIFFQLREDQAESFILWQLAPISIIVLVASLFFPGGLF